MIGTIEKYSDAAEAEQLAARIIAKPTLLDSRPAQARMSVGDLCKHFQRRELAQNDVWRSYSTRRNYIFYLNEWIIPRWKSYELAEVRTVEVEAWRCSLLLAKGTFRHTYSTLLRSVSAEFKVMQEMMRHSSLHSTLNVYTQAVTPAKHEAQAAFLSLVFSS